MLYRYEYFQLVAVDLGDQLVVIAFIKVDYKDIVTF